MLADFQGCFQGFFRGFSCFVFRPEYGKLAEADVFVNPAACKGDDPFGFLKNGIEKSAGLVAAKLFRKPVEARQFNEAGW
jgi:hypothetical protein